MTDDALNSLFLAHRRELQAYLMGKLRDADAAADLTQETFLRYAEFRSSMPGTIFNERSYLYRVAHNLAVDHTRRNKRRRTDLMAGDALADIPDDQPTLEDQTDARQRLERLTVLVSELPELTQRIFILNRIDGLTYSEVATRLMISDSSVQKHLAKALLHVTRRLKQGNSK